MTDLKPGRKSMDPTVRFFTKVTQTADCWLWNGAKTPNGYGQFRLAGRFGRLVLAHRFSYETKFGPIPEGLWALHKCDNPPCVNPDHLFIGDRSDNMRDCAKKGRLNLQNQHRSKPKIACLRGHVYKPETTILSPEGWKKCRICTNAAQNRRNHAARAI